MLLEQFGKSWDRNVERVGAIVVLEAGQLRLLLDTAR